MNKGLQSSWWFKRRCSVLWKCEVTVCLLTRQIGDNLKWCVLLESDQDNKKCALNSTIIIMHARWSGRIRTKDDGFIGRRMLRMELPGKKKRGRSKIRYMDAMREDTAAVEVTEEDAEVRTQF